MRFLRQSQVIIVRIWVAIPMDLCSKGWFECVRTFFYIFFGRCLDSACFNLFRPGPKTSYDGLLPKPFVAIVPNQASRMKRMCCAHLQAGLGNFVVCTIRNQRPMTHMFDPQILRELAASTLSRGNPFWMSCCQRASSNWRSLHDAMSLLRCKKQRFCYSKGAYKQSDYDYYSYSQHINMFHNAS